MQPDLSPEDAERLDTLLRAIEELDPDAELPGGASTEALDAAERGLGRPLPAQLREWYRTIGGGAVLAGGNLRTFAVVKERGVAGPYLATARNALRSREWFVPAEVIPFGFDGGGDVFGVWSPADPDPDAPARPLVVLIGAGDGAEDVPSCAVVGEDLYAFLTGWLAHYVYPAHEDVAEEVQDLLGLPLDLQGDPEEIARSVGAHLQATLRWASPSLPELTYDPDKGWPLSVDDVREIATAPW
ncbi:SMI1/KNR4 family protein [Patulibacter sp. SYSU D01012]|uniref:SMI1/KNR4 family protein n=1 Tax=Patulibacter sp. SYSU D01012 TaxID=2817381 RepID=UPI001B311431|nr:SMI1/KNR4 family protein [Patulibacter sp. SYSU D01012]